MAREIHHHRQFLHPHIARLYEVVVTESQVPRAKLVAAGPNGGRRIPELHPGNFQPSPDFDKPLPDEFWLGNSCSLWSLC